MANKQQLDKHGYTVMNDIFTDQETESIIDLIGKADSSSPAFRKSEGLFAIRQCLKEIPGLQTAVFNKKLVSVLKNLFESDYFMIKSIYFDKPEKSNWFVSYHQDLTISVDRKVEVAGFNHWTKKQDQFAVQPPIDILKSIYTIRIHLDPTNEQNGALRVIPGSHINGIRRPETIDLTKENEVICSVPKGGLMIMRPLLLHRSCKTTSELQRRVIHLEFSNTELPPGLGWAERTGYPVV